VPEIKFLSPNPKTHRLSHTHTHTHKTNKQTNKRTNRQTDRKADMERDKQIFKFNQKMLKLAFIFKKGAKITYAYIIYFLNEPL